MKYTIIVEQVYNWVLDFPLQLTSIFLGKPDLNHFPKGKKLKLKLKAFMNS